MLALADHWLPALPKGVPPLVAMAGSEQHGLPRLSWRWLIQIRMGDEEARQAFLEAWGPVIDQEVNRYAAKGGEPEELEAEGNLALWEGVTAYDPQRHKTTAERYIANRIHKSVRRRYLDQTGYSRPGSEVPLDLVEPQPQAERRFAEAERRLDLAGAVGALSPGDQQLFQRYLRLAEAGHGPDEAARLLAYQEGGSFAAWKKRLERTRRKVRRHLR